MQRKNDLTTSEMQAAVARRDKSYDGDFVYGVTSTGVFCKPSCPSRAARQDNQRYFPNPAAAALAGYRPCKRCKPDAQDPQLALMIDVARHIEGHAEQKLKLDALAARANLSASQLSRLFKKVFGLTPKAFQDSCRLKQYKSHLKSGEPVTEAIYAAGFGSPSRVYGQTARNIGMKPSVYREGGRGERIYYADSHLPGIGELLIAATERGICFVQFGESQQQLVEMLKSEFPRATLMRSQSDESEAFKHWVTAIEEHLRGEAPRPDLPLDLRGTAFQIKVWQYLLSTEAGDVVSYKEVAAGVGKARAIRAAASACGANRIAVLVPCHRVLRSDGQLGGYRWGLARKRTLLDRERRQNSNSGSRDES